MVARSMSVEIREGRGCGPEKIPFIYSGVTFRKKLFVSTCLELRKQRAYFLASYYTTAYPCYPYGTVLYGWRADELEKAGS